MDHQQLRAEERFLIAALRRGHPARDRTSARATPKHDLARGAA